MYTKVLNWNIVPNGFDLILPFGTMSYIIHPGVPFMDNVYKTPLFDIIDMIFNFSLSGEMIDKLTITFNRTRQAVITGELIEIISGAAAL